MDTETIKQTIKFNASIEVMTFDETSLLSNTMLSKLSQQRKDGKFCDAILTINKCDFSAHKCVLAASSTYFETMLSEVDDFSTKHKIQVFSNSSDILVQVLDYIYTGHIAINTDNFADIVDLAVRFSLKKLQDNCTKYLIKNINDKTCFHIHDLAKQHGLSALMNTVDGFVFANILKLIESESILEVGLTSLEILIGRSVPLLEEQRLTVITRWIEHKRTVRKVSLPVLLKLIHWSRLAAKDLNVFLENSRIILEDDWMYFHVLLSLNNADLMPESYKEKFNSFKEIFMKSTIAVATRQIDIIQIDDVDPTCDGGDELENEAQVYFDVSDSGTLFYPVEDEVHEPLLPTPPPPQAKRESSRLAVRLKRIQESQQQALPLKVKKEKTDMKSKINSSLKEANKENVTDILNVTSIKPTKIKELRAKKKRINRVLSTRIRRPRGSQQKEEMVTCSECPFKTNKAIKLERHFQVAHKDLTKIYSCDICQFACKWNRQFYDHLRDVHFPGPPFHCDKCGHSSVSIQQLLIHRMDHLESRPHCCTICGARFKVRYVLDAHLRSHSGEKPFQCSICHRSFTTKGTLDQHRGTHSAQRPYLCDLCGFSTKYQSHLKTHSRLHTGEVFKCQFPNCDYETPKRSRLACHQRSHLHVRCHTCSKCGRGFVERSHLVRHEKIHLDDRPFKCELCDYASTRRDKLKEHSKKHHDSTSADTNKMAYRPRKSRLLTSINKKSDIFSAPSDSITSQTTNKKIKQPAKRKLGPRILESIPEEGIPASSSIFAKRTITGKIRSGSDLIAREAEMRSWLEKNSKGPPISPIEIDTAAAPQTNLADVSPNFHSFSSLNSSSSGICKGQSGSSSSGIGSHGTGDPNLISPSNNNNYNDAIPSDLSSPGAGSSSSQQLSPSISGRSFELSGRQSKHMACIKIEKFHPKVCTQQTSVDLQASRRKVIQERLKRFVASKNPNPTPKKIITISLPAPTARPISFVTFKPDEPRTTNPSTSSSAN